MVDLKKQLLNGKTGTIRAAEIDGRVSVVLDEDKKKGIKVKPENLNKICGDDTASAQLPPMVAAVPAQNTKTTTTTTRFPPQIWPSSSLSPSHFSGVQTTDIGAEDDMLNAAIAMSMRDRNVEQQSQLQAAIVGGKSEEEMIQAAIKASMVSNRKKYFWFSNSSSIECLT